MSLLITLAIAFAASHNTCYVLTFFYNQPIPIRHCVTRLPGTQAQRYLEFLNYCTSHSHCPGWRCASLTQSKTALLHRETAFALSPCMQNASLLTMWSQGTFTKWIVWAIHHSAYLRWNARIKQSAAYIIALLPCNRLA